MTQPGQTAAAKMREAGESEDAIAAFTSALARLQAGAETYLPSAALAPVPDVPALEQLPAAGEEAGAALDEVAVIKLNGGLATSMGLHEPKSLLEARAGKTFLDVIVGQMLELRARYNARLPLVLMNSEATREAMGPALAAYPELAIEGLGRDFLQSMAPKLDAATLEPVSWPKAPALEWCPVGHGDIYSSLRGSGMLAALLAAGFRYAMVSNSDNLGAQADPRIALHMREQQIPFLMEVVVGIEADRKGGHLALRKRDGQIVLRELAQTAPEDDASFRDFRRWRYYNTNTLWFDLAAVQARLESAGGLELPVIVNRKTVDPRDPDSTPVIQLESAMGAAIGSFPEAELLQVPRERFVPVKTTDDLLVLRSDAYTMSDTFELISANGKLPYVELDKQFYKLIDDFEQRFPGGPPSLKQADRFVVRGDATFEPGVVVEGSVAVEAEAPLTVAAGTVLVG
jgi:UTP--glucose-1-phosphate uridylyltransferase